MQPYKNRNLPVGKLNYSLSNQEQDIVNSIDAMLEFGEKELLYDIPRIINGGNIANLGCCKGGSATLLAKGIKDRNLFGRVYTVDIYKKRRLQQALDKFSKFEVENLIEVCKGKTEDFFYQFKTKNLYFKFIFIDADHSYEGVKSDLLNYSKLLQKEGLIAFHDTNQEYTDRVINEFMQGKEMIYWVNRIKVFRC